MSHHQHETDRRECRHCGAQLSMWFCDACGSNSFDAVTNAYVAELASPWRVVDAARGPAYPVLPLAA